MDSLLPSALIIGIDNFVAIELAKELISKDIGVVGVGNFVSELADLNNFKWVSEVSEVDGKFNYVFDFLGDLSFFKKNEIEGDKFIFVVVDNQTFSNSLREELKQIDFNWRLVEAGGVYGSGMKSIGEGGNFLSEILELAVKNKNLEVPLPEQKITVLEVSDLVEAILRASFLSNTEKEYYLLLGEELESEDLAKILIDKAKMTKMKVFQREMEIREDIEEISVTSAKKLRWSPKVKFKEGIERVLQYFFSKIDEENRKKAKNKIKKDIFEIKEVEKNSLRMEVVVEDNVETSDNIWINKKETVKDEVKKIEEKPKEEMETGLVEEDDEFWEIPKFELKQKKIDIEKNVDKQEKLEIKDIPLLQNESKKTKNKKNNWFWLLLLGMGFLLFLTIPIDWGISTYLSIRNIKNVPELIKNKKYAKASEMIETNLDKITIMDGKINDWGLNGLLWFRNYQNLLKAMEDVLEVEKSSVSLAKSADVLMSGIFEDKNIDWDGSFSLTKQFLVDVDNKVAILQGRLTGDLSWLPSKWKMDVQKKSDELDKIKKQIDLGVKAMDIMPEFMGVNVGEKKYLVLFQNESELRATGGFIGSYGLLKFNSGKLIDLEVKDIYEADGQLDGHVEPPIEIKNYLGEASWYMRDANWKADFTESASDIQWFFKKETNDQVDGIIGIDLAVARSFLEAIGEVYVPDFDEKINKDNLYEQAEFYAEKKFFPGSNQKASFLGGLGKQMFEETKNLNLVKKMELTREIIDLFEKNEIQLAINDSNIAKKINDLGWDGKIYNGDCGLGKCIMDYLYVVESNLGVNKANYFLNRNIEEAVDISGGSLSRVVKINYENTAKNTNWPGGDYKNYIRIYLPKDVNLSQITVMDGVDTTIKKVYTNDELRIREINGKKEIGFLMTVPVMKKRIVEVRYSSNLDLSTETKFSYFNYIQRQSGSGETNMVNLVSIPDGWQPVQVQPNASLVGGKLLFNQKLDRDIKMGVELEK